MSLIASTTAMTANFKKHLNAWSDPISNFFTSVEKEVDNNLTSGVVIKVFKTIRYSYFGTPYITALFGDNGKEASVLICCGPKSDFCYKTGLSLEGLYIKPQKTPGLVNKFKIRSFDDVVNEEERNYLRDIDAGKKEFIPVGTTATGLVDKEIQDKNDPIPHKDGAESELEYIEKNLSKKEIIAGLRIHYFLIH